MKWIKRKGVNQFSKDENIVKQLLKIRGISDHRKFLNPSSEVLNDPHLLGNIDKASEIILEALKKNARIAVSVDCDSDGVFSTATMVRYLAKFTQNFYIMYNQRSEGHGIENQMNMLQEGTDLIIVLDSSTNSIDALKELHEKGIQVVVLDHHDKDRKNPYGLDNPYATIVNPKLDDTYPNKLISGAGVTYKMLQVLDESLGTGEVDDLIDLVGCGMYADMMPCNVLENRYIIIQAMQNITNKGLLAILKVSDVPLEKVNSQTIGFTISPLINGAARKDKIELAIELLLCDDFIRCVELVNEIKELNEQRKAEEKALFEQYVSKVDMNDKILIAIDENASKNYNGLIANRIAQEYKKPAIVMRTHEGTLAGSYRTFGSLDMEEFLNQKSVRKLINYAVGHSFAGGIALKESNLKAFKDTINEKLEGVTFESIVEYDLEIMGADINATLLKEIEEFDYCTGTDFPPATFLVRELFVEGDTKVMGKNRDTVKIQCDYADVIKFKTNEDWANDVGVLDSIDVVGQLKLNEWTNWKKEVKVTAQVVAEDYKII
jgi:single-stranded-DNA-specific exonuclease